jgi:hypothetical protein
MTVSAYEVILPGNALVLAPEAPYVRETDTGLVFEPDTPIEVWGALTDRLIRQSKRIEWAIGDAIRFGEQAYGEDRYTQWIEETGLSENTLTTYRWVAERIEPLRRRKDLGWSHHREVASLPVPAQETLLDAAESAGLTRWQVRQAAKVERERIEGRAATTDGTPLDDDPPLVWVPGKADLTDEAREALEQRLAGMGKSYRIGGERMWIDALVWGDVRDAFTSWEGPE